MTASRIADVNKNKVSGWLNEDGVIHGESDTSAMPLFRWVLQLKDTNLAIYTMDKFPDRVILQSDITFTAEQQDLLHKQWQKPQLDKLLLNITSSLTTFNVRYNILHTKEIITGIRISLFLIDGLNKEVIIKCIARIGEVLAVTLNQLSSVIGVELQQLKEQQKESSFNPLAT